jgi:hypothetical protein
MKLLIEIPDDHKRVIDNLVEDCKGYLLPYEVENRMAVAIRNGKVLDNMTNGDIIKAMFPNVNFYDAAFTVHATTDVTSNGVKGGISYDFWKTWWNEPYRKAEE